MVRTRDERTPDDWATSVVLADGETGYLRPMTAADAPALLAFHERQPRENLYRRFFSPKPSLTDAELAHFTQVDFVGRVALVLEIHGEFAAWASYEKWPGRSDADVAFMVDDVHRGKGIATLMLEHLAAIARSNGINRFTADVLADNRPMLVVFSRAGWPVQRHFDSGVIELEFPLTDTEQFVDSVEGRERRADSRSIARLLLPRSVAVIGASDEPGSIGNEVWRSVASGGVQPIFAVNSRRDTVGGTRAYPTVLDIDHDVWLAVVAVPASALATVIDQCIEKRVRGAVVLTAVDGTDVDMAAIVAKARRYGMRIIGPASMGVATGRVALDGATSSEPAVTPTTTAEPAATESAAPSNATTEATTEAPSVGVQAALVPVGLPAGGVAISLQSGSLGASLLQLATQMSMGISWFVSLGDKSDVSGNDLLQFWEDDERTSVIAIYTESFGNPRKFARIARRVSRTRPIVAVRTGAAALGIASEALYQQAGVIEVPTVRAMLDTARVLACQPVPSGPRVAVLTNSRSPGVLAAAALVDAGLEVVPAPRPLDWRSTIDDYGPALADALADPANDAVLVMYAPPIMSAQVPDEVIAAAAAGTEKPVVAVMLGRHDGPVCHGSRVPSFSFPEPAAAVLGHLVRYRRWLDTEGASSVAELDHVDLDAATDAVMHALEGVDASTASTVTAGIADVEAVLTAYGVKVARAELTDAVSVDDVAAVASRVGYPVSIKAEHRRAGRSAEAGIALDLADADAVRDAAVVMRASLGADAACITVQQMVPPGVDVRIRCTTDERLGPVITVGLGGIMADAIGDEESRLAPVSAAAAANLVQSSRLGHALAGAGLPIDALVDTITRVSHLVDQHPAVLELDINPAIVSRGGCWVVDAHVVLTAAAPAEAALRRLV
ncbi:MAG: GNAT family N-acetyltransferase [Acidimicrobiales bacterium]|nr:GNAT family N-acetyltransferase [Acidimicrobiales bacterium]MCB9394863.1 GNAT family N-acetyltransferase [Acidimicrobiaceae bacterium]